MTTAAQYGYIAAVIAVAGFTVLMARDYLRPIDPVAARYAKIDAECAKPRPDGGRRDIVWMPEYVNLFGTGGYVVCPRKD